MRANLVYVVATLFFGLSQAEINVKENPTVCVALHCFLETGACVADSECYAILDCLQVGTYFKKNYL